MLSRYLFKINNRKSKFLFNFRWFSENNIKINSMVEEKIFHVIKMTNKCKHDKLSRNATFEELGFDSLDAVELIVAFEEHLGFDISNEDAENKIKTVNDALIIFTKYYNEKVDKESKS